MPWDYAFAASSLLIAVPTGVKVFNWIATMWGGSIRLTTSMLFAIAFLFTFAIGGLSGVTFAAAPIDWQMTDTYYVVAHFHYVLFGGTLFARVGGHLLLVSEDERPHAFRELGQGAFLADGHRLQHDLLRPAFPRPAWNAAPGLHVSGSARAGPR